MTRAACPLKVVVPAEEEPNGPPARKRERAPELMRGEPRAADAARPAPEGAAGDSRQRLERARHLARKLARRDRLADQLREADAEVHAAFGPFAAGRRISLEDARKHLTSAGFLRERKVWE